MWRAMVSDAKIAVSRRSGTHLLWKPLMDERSKNRRPVVCITRVVVVVLIVIVIVSPKVYTYRLDHLGSLSNLLLHACLFCRACVIIRVAAISSPVNWHVSDMRACIRPKSCNFLNGVNGEKKKIK